MKNSLDSKFKVKSNKSKRTFTLFDQTPNGKTIAKYRTEPQPKLWFEAMENYTDRDWRVHLSTNNDYSVIK
jgi:hypothetical protein